MGVVLAAGTLLIALMQGVSGKTWNLKLPQKIEAIGDSCVTVPCHFDVPNEEEVNVLKCSDGAVWKRGSVIGPVVFTPFTPSTNTMRGQIVGDLTKKNCTTMFRSFPKNLSDVYFFRLECPNNVKFTFQNGVAINIQEPPPPELSSVSQLSEGDQVRLRCSVPVPCPILPPSITWLPRDNSRHEQTQMQQSVGRLPMMTSTLTFSASADHHNQSISCCVSYPLTEGGSSEPSAATRTLNVLYAPRVPVVTRVSEGGAVTLTCWSDANPPVSRYTWHRVDGGKLTKKGEGEKLVLQVSQEDSGVYLCEAGAQKLSYWSRHVTLEVDAAAGGIEGVVALPSIMCGVLLVLYITTVVVDVYKYQSISRRLKQIELKGEHTYSGLRTCSVPSDYDRLQPRQPKANASLEDHNYENPVVLQAGFKNEAPPKRT